MKLFHQKSSEPRKKRPKQKSICACDYEGWDKFDADAELDRIDLQDERSQLEAKSVQHRQREKVEKAKKLSKESIVNKREIIYRSHAINIPIDNNF